MPDSCQIAQQGPRWIQELFGLTLRFQTVAVHRACSVYHAAGIHWSLSGHAPVYWSGLQSLKLGRPSSSGLEASFTDYSKLPNFTVAPSLRGQATVCQRLSQQIKPIVRSVESA